MKKVITCALILSLLGAMGTVCVASSSAGGYWEGGHFIEVNDDDWGSPDENGNDADDVSYEETDENSSMAED